MQNTKLYAIGGGLKLELHNKILKSFVNDIGNENAKLLLIPSYLEDEVSIDTTWKLHKDIFESLGIKDIDFCRPFKGVFSAAQYENLVDNATGVFFAGGSQRQLTNMLGGTKFLEDIKSRWGKGKLTIAGTSAGCAALSEIIILGGFEEPKYGTGFGFRKDIIFDQHFSSGNANSRQPRFKRLLKAMYDHKNLTGVGVDENTCAVIKNNVLTTIGEANVTLINTQYATETVIETIEGLEQIKEAGVKVRILSDGESVSI